MYAVVTIGRCMVAYGYYDNHVSVGVSFFKIARVVNLINNLEQIIVKFELFLRENFKFLC